MATNSKIFKLAKLLAKFIRNEVSDDEKNVIEEWMQSSPSNRVLFERFKDDQNLVKRIALYDKINWQEDFKLFIKKKRRLDRKRNYFIILKYAAALFIPIAFTAYFLFLTDNPFSFTKNEPIVIAGGNKATLTLADGSLIDLVSDTNNLFEEMDGSRIIRSNGILAYKATDQITQIKDSNRLLKPIYNKLNVPRGGEWKLTLSDGTRVWVNSETILNYPVSFVGNKRIVHLSGEAYFEVAENKEKPFIVVANKCEIEVLGTSFNVRSYKEELNITTTLVEGKVKIASSTTKEKETLESGEQGVLHAVQGYILKSRVDVSYYTAWKDGRFAFRKERLEDIMIKLSKWYDVEVVFKGEGLKNKTFTGNIKRYENLNQILKLMEENRLISFNVRGKQLILENYN